MYFYICIVMKNRSSDLLRVCLSIALLPLFALSMVSCDPFNEFVGGLGGDDDSTTDGTDVVVTGAVSGYGCTYADIVGYAYLKNLPTGTGNPVMGIEVVASDAEPNVSPRRETSSSLKGNAFEVSLRNLSPGTEYTYRSYVKHGGVTYYGVDSTFVTEELINVATTGEATNVTCSSAVITSMVQIDALDANENINVGVAYAVTPTALYNDSVSYSYKLSAHNVVVDGECAIELSYLSDNTTYYYATFTEGGGVCQLSEMESFTTLASPILSASADNFVADGEDVLVLTVMSGDMDVTSEAQFFVNGQPMEGNSFVTTVTGTYKFFAKYKNQATNQIAVTATLPPIELELPEDSQADTYDNFGRKALFTQATGTWCGYCPYMIRSIEMFRESGVNAANVVVVATHGSDELSSGASEAVIRALNVQGFPSAYFNLNPNLLIENYDPSYNAGNIDGTAGEVLAVPANVGIAAVTGLNADGTAVGVRATVKVGTSGSYRINAWLVEDGVSAYQSSYWEGFASGVISHDHVLRAASNMSPIQGTLLGGNETCEHGETIEFYHGFDVKEIPIADVTRCKVVVLVTAEQDGKYYVDNVIECAVGESVPFVYNE